MIITYLLLAIVLFVVAKFFINEALELIGIPLILCGLFFGYLFGKSAYDWDLERRSNDCAQYGTVTERETKFTKLSWGSWECFVKIDDNWVARSQIIEQGRTND